MGARLPAWGFLLFELEACLCQETVACEPRTESSLLERGNEDHASTYGVWRDTHTRETRSVRDNRSSPDLQAPVQKPLYMRVGEIAHPVVVFLVDDIWTPT